MLNKLKQELTTLTTKTNELFNLTTELTTIQDKIDVLKAANGNYSDLSLKFSVKQTQVNRKQLEINQVQSNIDQINADINNLKSLLAIENNFTPEQIQERNNYIIEKTWADENYIDAHELYDDAKVKFDEIRKPKINIDISAVNFFKMIDEQRNWNKLYLGDVVTVRHPMIKVDYEVFVTDIEISDDNINLTITDFEEAKKDEKLLEMLKASYSSSTTVDMNKYKWNQTTSDLGEINDIINNTWDAAKRKILAGVNETVEISNRGISIRSSSNPNDVIIMQSGIVALSSDNGQNWKTAITPSHIVADVIMGKLIAGVNLVIENEEGKFTFDSNGATIDGASLTIKGGQNGITLSPDDGLTLLKDDNKVKVLMNSIDGFKIQKFSNDVWTDQMSIDTDGNIKLTPITEMDTKLRDDLKLTAPLPNNISLGSDGIKATTSDPNKFAIMDYRGFYVKGGAFTVERPDGAKWIQDGVFKNSLAIQQTYPPFLGSEISASFNDRYYRTGASDYQHIGAYYANHDGRYMKIEGWALVSQAAMGFVVDSIHSYKYIYHATTIPHEPGSTGGTRFEVVIDLGIPTYEEMAFYLMIRSASTPTTIGCRINKVMIYG